MREIPLTGGVLSDVVRVGDTVRRPARPWTPAVHALLQHLEHRGFEGAPRVRGFDDKGREVLEYVEGDVFTAPGPLPAQVGADGTLRAVGRMLRALHDATVGFVAPPDAQWQGFVRGEDPDGVVCHNDAAFYNTVFRAGSPVAWIDWDFAAPAPRLWDVAFVAWRWVPLHDPRTAAAHAWPPTGDPSRRLVMVCEAYGLDEGSRDRLIATVRARMEATAEGISSRAARGEEGFRRLVRRGVVDGVRRDVAWLEAHAGALRTG